MKPQEFANNLKGAAKELQNGKALLASVGQTVAAKVKPHVRVRTGRLQGSIDSYVEGNAAYVFSDVEYAPFVDARFPFMQPGLDDSSAEIEQKMAAWGQGILEKAAHGGGGDVG